MISKRRVAQYELKTISEMSSISKQDPNFFGALHGYPSPNVLYAYQNSTPSVFNFLFVLLFKNSPTTHLVVWKAFCLCFSIIQLEIVASIKLEYCSLLPQTIFQTLDVEAILHPYHNALHSYSDCQGYFSERYKSTTFQSDVRGHILGTA